MVVDADGAGKIKTLMARLASNFEFVSRGTSLAHENLDLRPS